MPCRKPLARLHPPAMLALVAFVAVGSAARAETLCLQVTMNDAPAGAETRLRLAADGQPARSVRPAGGSVRLDDLAPGHWTLTVQHPRTKAIRTGIDITGPAEFLLDCGYADAWSGCQVKPLPGGC